jgi:hypothetical protein
MTTDTQTDQQAIAAMAAQQEAERIEAELQAAMDAINLNLEALHQSEDPTQRLELAKNTSDWCGYLTSLTANAAALSGSAIAMAQEALTQRDAAMQELAELTDAVIEMDRENPLIDTLVESVEENVSEWAFESAMEDAYESTAEDLMRDVMRTLEVDWQEADRFVDVMRGQYRPWQKTAPSQEDVIDHLIASLEARRARVTTAPSEDEGDE